MNEAIPNTLEEIKAKLAQIEAEEAKKNKPKTTKQLLEEAQARIAELESKTIAVMPETTPPTPPQPIKITDNNSKYDPDLHVTKVQAAVEVARELKLQKAIYTGTIINYLIVLGLAQINFYAGGVVALVGVGITAYFLAKKTQKASYLKATYGAQ